MMIKIKVDKEKGSEGISRERFGSKHSIKTIQNNNDKNNLFIISRQFELVL